MQQYNTLLAAAPLLESVLNKKDIQVVRPGYGVDANASKPVEEEQEEKQQSTAQVVDDDEDDEE